MADFRLLTTPMLTAAPVVPAVATLRPRRAARRIGGESARLRALAEVGDAIASAVDTAEIAQRACEAIMRLVPATDHVSLRLVDEPRGGAVLAAASGYPSEYGDEFAVLPLDANWAVGRAILSLQIQHGPEPAVPHAPLADRMLGRLGARSYVAVPLPRVGQTAGATQGTPALGALILSSRRRGAFGPKAEPFLLALSQLLARALAHARDRVRADAQARSAEQLITVLASIEDAVWVTDTTGRVTLTNAAAARVVGAEPREEHQYPLAEWNPLVAGRDFQGQAIAADDLPIARALRGEHFTYMLLRTQNPYTGAELSLRVAGGPLRDAGGALVGAVVTGNDITRRLMLERQRDALVAATGHDIRNPLAALKGSIQLLLKRAAAAEPAHEFDAAPLQRMARVVNRVSLMVDDLVDVALVAEKRLTLNRAAMDLVALAREVVEEQAAGNQRHTIILQPSVSRLAGTWDRNRLERVLANLIANAVKFSPEGSAIEVRVWREVAQPGGASESYARVSVTDHGRGIPPEHLAHLFEWYFRTPESIGQTQGSGIGLAISRELLVAHGGRIWAESAGPGQGSTFHLALPHS